MPDIFSGLVIDDEQTIDRPVNFTDLEVSGSASFLDIVESDNITVSGYAAFRNFTTCDRIEVSGKADCTGRLLTETAKVTGELSVTGKATADVLVVEGKTELKSRFSCGRILVRKEGFLGCSGKMKVDRLTVNGTIQCDTGVSCRSAEILSCEKSFAGEIVADTVKVSYVPSVFKPGIKDGDYILVAPFIDGDEVFLEYTDAACVYCHDAVIGRGTRVGELVSDGNVRIESGAVVERWING